MTEQEYEELLNETYYPVDVLGFPQMPGTALRKLDYIAFRQMYLEYINEYMENA